MDRQINRYRGFLDQTFISPLFLLHLMANQLTFTVLVSGLYKSELPPLTVKMATAWKKSGGIILLPCDFHSPLRSWKWQDAVCFCLLINISEHYTWNAPVTLNIGPVRTPLLSSLVIWHQVMRSESWKSSASRSPSCLPILPSTPYLMKSVRELLEDVGAFIKSRGRKYRGNIGYVKGIGMEGSSSREAKG